MHEMSAVNFLLLAVSGWVGQHGMETEHSGPSEIRSQACCCAGLRGCG